MVSQIEEVTLRISAAGAYLGGMASMVLSTFGAAIAANLTAAISLSALIINWYYLRRRDRREQTKFEREMK